MTQHSTLTLERWRQFDKAQQILMIGNEMNRGKRLTDPERLRRCYGRVLRLTDLTAQAADRHAFRREILRWRDGIAELYLAGEPDSERHMQLFEHLLLMTPESARQRPYVLR
jgi:methylphosphotriester-DNA--protein-cysteine methyltransferase